MIFKGQEQNGSLAESGKWNVILIVNSVPDKSGQVRYQRILGLTRTFNVFVVTRATLPAELSELVEEVRVARSRKQMLREAIAISKDLADKNKKFYVHTQYLPFTGIVGYSCKRITGCKWIYDLWDHPSLKWAHIRGPMRWWRKGIWSVFRRLVLPRSDAWIIAMHPGILGQLPAAPVSCRLIFSNPGYIPEESGDRIFPTAGENSEVSIVYAGLIKSNRGFDLMSEWARSYSGLQKVKLHLIGRCSESTKRVLDKLVENSEDRASLSLQIHGEIPHSNVLKILSRSNIGLCPINPDVLNYQYAFPVKIIEYLGSGLVVVATRAHGICAMVSENETGYTFDYNLESFSIAMEKAIAACMNEESVNRKLPGSDHLVENYQWDLVNERLSKDILQVL
ncbi:MAG: glycosyltransferase [Gammaproteobacteria bacterium]|nr:glycosyltransferase [Gammaproteobacteria bacterium]